MRTSMAGRARWAWSAWVLAATVGCSAAGGGGDDPGGSGGSGSGSGSGGSGAANGGSGAGTGTGGTISLGGSGGSGGVVEECAGVTQEANNAVLPADIIWAIDTSCSMDVETAAVRANMNTFSQGIVASGVDARVSLIAEQYSEELIPFFNILEKSGICIDAPLGSGQCPGDTNLPGFAHIYQTVASTDALQLILSTFPQWRGQLRPNSLKVFVVVTDDESAISAADFTAGVDALEPSLIRPGQWQFYGIHCFTNCPQAAAAGTVYTQLVNQTGGVAGDLCLQDFMPVFNRLAQSVVGSAQLDCGWGIPPAPVGEVFDKGKVNVVFTPGGGSGGTTFGKVASAADCGPQGGWYYDDEAAPTTVLVCPSSCDLIQADPNGKVDVKFGCATVPVPE